MRLSMPVTVWLANEVLLTELMKGAEVTHGTRFVLVLATWSLLSEKEKHRGRHDKAKMAQKQWLRAAWWATSTCAQRPWGTSSSWCSSVHADPRLLFLLEWPFLLLCTWCCLQDHPAVTQTHSQGRDLGFSLSPWQNLIRKVLLKNPAL